MNTKLSKLIPELGQVQLQWCVCIYSLSYIIVVFTKLTDVELLNFQLRNEFSLCRVYVTSGSLRSFDRRPVGIEIDSRRMTEASSSMMVPMVAERASSQDSSSSGEHRNNEQSGAGAASTSTNVQMIEEADLELLDWL